MDIVCAKRVGERFPQVRFDVRIDLGRVAVLACGVVLTPPLRFPYSAAHFCESLDLWNHVEFQNANVTLGVDFAMIIYKTRPNLPHPCATK